MKNILTASLLTSTNVLKQKSNSNKITRKHERASSSARAEEEI